jgi:hypothetical protein
LGAPLRRPRLLLPAPRAASAGRERRAPRLELRLRRSALAAYRPRLGHPPAGGWPPWRFVATGTVCVLRRGRHTPGCGCVHARRGAAVEGEAGGGDVRHARGWTGRWLPAGYRCQASEGAPRRGLCAPMSAPHEGTRRRPLRIWRGGRGRSQRRGGVRRASGGPCTVAACWCLVASWKEAMR